LEIPERNRQSHAQAQTLDHRSPRRFVLDQKATLERLKKFLGFPLVAIPVKPEAVGRWKTDKEKHDFDFFQEDLIEHGYKTGKKAKAKRA